MPKDSRTRFFNARKARDKGRAKRKRAEWFEADKVSDSPRNPELKVLGAPSNLADQRATEEAIGDGSNEPAKKGRDPVKEAFDMARERTRASSGKPMAQFLKEQKRRDRKQPRKAGSS